MMNKQSILTILFLFLIFNWTLAQSNKQIAYEIDSINSAKHLSKVSLDKKLEISG